MADQRQSEIKRGEADEIAGAAHRLQRLEQHVFVDRDGDIAQREPYQVERDEQEEQAELGGFAPTRVGVRVAMTAKQASEPLTTSAK